jgi:hypothetical protein
MADEMKPDSNGSAGKVALALVREHLAPSMDRIEESLDRHTAILAEIQAQQLQQGIRLVALEECNKELKVSRASSGKILKFVGWGGLVFLASIVYTAGKIATKIDAMADTIDEQRKVIVQLVDNVEALNIAQAKTGVQLEFLAGSRTLPEPTREKVEVKREAMALPRAPRIKTLE